MRIQLFSAYFALITFPVFERRWESVFDNPLFMFQVRELKWNACLFTLGLSEFHSAQSCGHAATASS